MIKNYLKLAIRNLQKQKMFAFINVLGLSTGIACFALLLLYSYNELSFDKFNKNASNIYRPYVWFNEMNGQAAQGYMDYSGTTSATLGEAMKEDLPDVINVVRIQLPYGESLVRTNRNTFRSNITYADPSLFSMFSFPLQYGNTATALRNMNDVVLTQSKAKELFGTDDATGQIIEIKIGNDFLPFAVSAIAKDIPGNSTVKFDVLGNFIFAEKYVNGNNFIGSDFHYIEKQTFVQLKPGSTLSNDTKQLERFLAKFNPGYLSDLQSSGVKWPANQPPVSLRLQALTSMHTSTINLWHDFPRIDIKTVWILLAIATGILLIACINFTTLAIGRSAGRSKEVGVRKVIGAAKAQLIFQFLTEAVLLAFISTIAGLFLAIFLLPWFNKLSGTNFYFTFALYPKIFFLVIVLVIVIGFLAGSYPAFILSRFKPNEALKNKIRIGGSNLFTKSLVTFQFSLSIILIIATAIILQQTKFMVNKSPGFNKENVVVINASETNPGKIFPLFKQALLNHPSIEGITSAAAGIGEGQSYLGYSDQGISADINIVDADYIKVLGMKLIAGNNFYAAETNDSIKSMIINETMMSSFGWTTQNVVGKRIKNFQGRTAVVTGVVKNFNYHPLSEAVKNQAFITSKDNGYVNFYVRIKPGNPAPALVLMRKEWNNVLPGIPMKYSFLDEDVNNYYKAEERWSGIVGWASGLSIFLACLGLLGLATLAAINRTKEIGIRKVLGATVPNLVAILLKDFLQLIFIAFIIASPLAWYFMNKWLQDYANRININVWVFVLAGAGAILIALVILSFQAIKAALANPVKSLRTE